MANRSCFRFLLVASAASFVSCRTLDYEIRTTWDGRPAKHDGIKLHLEGLETGVELNVTSPFFNAPSKPKEPPGPLFGLWNYEVVEMFFLNDEDEYLEVEIGPWGHHLLLLLRGARKAILHTLPLDYIYERIKNDQGQETQWRGSAFIPKSYFPPRVSRMNAYAIHGSEPGKVYEALYPAPTSHPDYPQPDFHRLELFQPIDFERLLPGHEEYSDLWRKAIQASVRSEAVETMSFALQDEEAEAETEDGEVLEEFDASFQAKNSAFRNEGVPTTPTEDAVGLPEVSVNDLDVSNTEEGVNDPTEANNILERIEDIEEDEDTDVTTAVPEVRNALTYPALVSGVQDSLDVEDATDEETTTSSASLISPKIDKIKATEEEELSIPEEDINIPEDFDATSAPPAEKLSGDLPDEFLDDVEATTTHRLADSIHLSGTDEDAIHEELDMPTAENGEELPDAGVFVDATEGLRDDFSAKMPQNDVQITSTDAKEQRINNREMTKDEHVIEFEESLNPIFKHLQPKARIDKQHEQEEIPTALNPSGSFPPEHDPNNPSIYYDYIVNVNSDKNYNQYFYDEVQPPPESQQANTGRESSVNPIGNEEPSTGDQESSSSIASGNYPFQDLYLEPHPICTREGLVPDDRRCQVFYECVIENYQWKMYSWRCQRGHVFDPVQIACIRGHCSRSLHLKTLNFLGKN